MKLVEDAFAPGGPIALALPGFEAREGQVRMARLIQRGFLENVHTIVEAGTGVGKSLAYLVPALRAGARVVVSTGTIALQEQLVRKDIPLVTKALDIDARVVLLKGRNHYLCKAKFEKESGARLIAPSLALERLWAWAERTETGDRAELEFTPRAEDWETLDADADDCVGEYCSRFADCHFFARRDAARFADVVVVNHALFFLDLVSGGALLPAYDFVILDEAHQAEKYATAALTATLSPVSVNRMMRKLHRTYAVPAAYDAELDEAMRRLQQTLASVPGDKYPIAANEGVFEVLPVLRESLYRLENWLHANWKDGLRRPIDNEAEAERRRDLALRSIAAHVATVDRIENAALQATSGAVSADEIEAVAWVERGDAGERYEVNAAPFSVAEFLRGALFARTRSVVLTSATISTNTTSSPSGAPSDPFAFLKSSLGVDEAQQLVAPSPFDYAKQARLYVAPSRLNPKAVDFARRAAPLIEEILDRSGGRAFVLFTSYARLREVYALLRERIPFPVKVQGDLPRTALLDWFRSTRSAVLFATGTFWEGIDVVGDALSCVVIDRLPFPSPSEPLVAARIAALEARGLSGFEHYMIPSAIVRLKQGFGRLIRSTTDRGVVALLDGRASSMRYGATIIDALPPATRVTDLAAIDDLFNPQ
jgi:ATP-dependent DNA helicase DinG